MTKYHAKPDQWNPRWVCNSEHENLIIGGFKADSFSTKTHVQKWPTLARVVLTKNVNVPRVSVLISVYHEETNTA